MSIVKIVDRNLRKNSEIIIVKARNRIDAPAPPIEIYEGKPSHLFSYDIAPKNEINTADGMNAFMRSLIPEGLEPVRIDSFKEGTEEFRFANMRFQEKSGHFKMRVPQYIKEIFPDHDYSGEDRLIESTNTVVINPYPNEKIAKAVSTYNLCGAGIYEWKMSQYFNEFPPFYKNKIEVKKPAGLLERFLKMTALKAVA